MLLKRFMANDGAKDFAYTRSSGDGTVRLAYRHELYHGYFLCLDCGHGDVPDGINGRNG